MKHLKLFEAYKKGNMPEGGTPEQRAAMEVLLDEMDWNVPRVTLPTDEDIKAYSHAKGMTPENGIIYWCMPGQSVRKELMEALQKHQIKAKVYRGYETSRRSFEHDYIIVLQK